MHTRQSFLVLIIGAIGSVGFLMFSQHIGFAADGSAIPRGESCFVITDADLAADEQRLCAQDVAEVCGNDGHTYSNRCAADAADVVIDYDGACKPAEPLLVAFDVPFTLVKPRTVIVAGLFEFVITGSVPTPCAVSVESKISNNCGMATRIQFASLQDKTLKSKDLTLLPGTEEVLTDFGGVIVRFDKQDKYGASTFIVEQPSVGNELQLVDKNFTIPAGHIQRAVFEALHRVFIGDDFAGLHVSVLARNMRSDDVIDAGDGSPTRVDELLPDSETAERYLLVAERNGVRSVILLALPNNGSKKARLQKDVLPSRLAASAVNRQLRVNRITIKAKSVLSFLDFEG